MIPAAINSNGSSAFFIALNLVKTRRHDKTCRIRTVCLHFGAMLIDYHMHTRLTDGAGVPADYARVALERGLDEIGCSEHAPLGNRDTDWTLSLKDLDTYVGWVREAQ